MGFVARLGTGIKRGFFSTGRYVRDSYLELKKVRWPNRKEMRSYTAIVVTTVVVAAIFFALIDMALTYILEWIVG